MILYASLKILGMQYTIPIGIAGVISLYFGFYKLFFKK